MTRKERIEIPADIAAKVLFLSDRTCCVCRECRKPIQIHHIDENPSNAQLENLVVVCFDCHRNTQIRGGFDRKLDAHQLLLYRQDWYARVEGKRAQHEGSSGMQPGGPGVPPGIPKVFMQNGTVHLGYFTSTENNEEQWYSFDAAYPQIMPEELLTSPETNLCIAAFVTRSLMEFRAEAIARSGEKKRMRQEMPTSSLVWDDLSISHNIGTFTEDLLTVEFRMISYFALAAHPNSLTKTLNFALRPSSVQLEFSDLFRAKSAYLELVSTFCVAALHAQLPPALQAGSVGETNNWILQGAGPLHRNFEKFLLVEGGLRVFFDPYQAGSYAEGRREVFVPTCAIASVLNERFTQLLR
jgi:hypothetical protein